MVEAVEDAQCYEIAEEVLKEVYDHIKKQNENTLEKTLRISMRVFSKGSEIKNICRNETFKKDLIKISNERRIENISRWVARLEMPFDKLEFCITLLVDSNEVFRENKHFDQFRTVTNKVV